MKMTMKITRFPYIRKKAFLMMTSSPRVYPGSEPVSGYYCDCCKQEVPKLTYYGHKKLRLSEKPGAVNGLDDSDDYKEYDADADSS